MTSFFFEGEEFLADESETVLESLTRQGVKIPHSCRSGICQSCLLKSTSEVDGTAQKGLTPAKREAGLFLSCQQRTRQGLDLYRPDTSTIYSNARITSQERISDSVVVIRVKPTDHYSFKAGQFTNLVRSDGVSRPYSIASATGSQELEFHIRRIDNGVLSRWFYDQDLVHETISLSTPLGECTLTAEMQDKDLVLIGVGTGLAPLYGVIKDAIANESDRQIHLFHGSLSIEGLYLIEKLKLLEEQYRFFNYYPTYLRGEEREGFYRRDLVDSIKAFPFDHEKAIVMICGDPVMVKKLKQVVFLAGTPSKNILSDPFVSQG